jgi:hypothetical protein
VRLPGTYALHKIEIPNAAAHQVTGKSGGIAADVAIFFVSYIFLCSVIMLNVVVAVLLDEFVSYIAREKDRKYREHQAELEKVSRPRPPFLFLAPLLHPFLHLSGSLYRRKAETDKAVSVVVVVYVQMRITGCLDPLTKTLIDFDDEQDLVNKIDSI